MAKQTFTTGQVLTAAQVTSLQATALGGGATTAKTASYVLLAADAGTVVQMNSSSATTITVNQSLFAQGDSLQIQNVGAGVCTVTAGTATVSTAGSLALSQYEGGQLYFNTTSAALFFDVVQSAAAGGKVFQVVNATYGTETASATSTLVDTGLTATITPSLATSKVLVLVSQNGCGKISNATSLQLALFRGATNILSMERLAGNNGSTSTINNFFGSISTCYLDSPSTTSATTYKTQMASQNNLATVYTQYVSIEFSTITLLEIGA